MLNEQKKKQKEETEKGGGGEQKKTRRINKPRNKHAIKFKRSHSTDSTITTHKDS